MGGSGTRAVARVLREAGIFMGTNTNGVKEDALELSEFDYRWAPPFLKELRTGRPWIESDAMSDEHRRCVDAHLREAGSNRAWGWKHCPSGHLLPFLAERHAGLRVVHLVRDGRDMAFGSSGGRTHTLRLGRAVLDGDPAPVIPGSDSWRGRAATAAGGPEATPERQARFWSETNTAIADWGDAAGDGRYLRLRFEDLAANPRPGVAELLEFVGLPAARDRLADLAAPIQRPTTIGRWKRESKHEVESLRPHLDEGLERFAYLDETAA